MTTGWIVYPARLRRKSLSFFQVVPNVLTLRQGLFKGIRMGGRNGARGSALHGHGRER